MAANGKFFFGIGQLKIKFDREHLWKVLYKVSSKQNDGWATRAQLNEPLVFTKLNNSFKFLAPIIDGTKHCLF
jgi:hypothetical protein